MKLNLKSAFPYLLPVLVIVVVNIMYFFPQFEGKVIQQGDIVQYEGMANEAIQYQKKSGEPALWTNSMFGGMPTFQISAPSSNNFLSYIEKIGSLGIDRPAGNFIFGMLGFYLLLLLLGVNPWLSLIGSLMFGFSTNNLILFEAGHTSKVRAIMTAAPIIAGVIMVFRERYLTGGVIFGVALGINIGANHPQMTYYLAMCLSFLVLAYLVTAIREKKLGSFGIAIATLVIFSLPALGSSASRLWTTLEYSKDTMRGKPILEKRGDAPSSSSEVDGLDWEYAMSWSNGSKDLLSSFIPKAVGGGSGEWLSKDSHLVKKLNLRKEIQAPTYWGDLPFTSGPIYFGAVVFFLFVFGLFAVKGELKWWLMAAVLLTFMISLGKNMAGFNKFLFDNLPLFNNFRTPNSVLSVTAVLLPILGILGISEVIKSKDKSEFIKPLYYSAGILGGICLVFALFGGSFFNFSAAGDEQYAQIIDALLEQRESMLKSSAWRSLFLILIVAGAMWAYFKGKMTSSIMIAIIGVAGVMDLFVVGKDYLSAKDFVSDRSYKQNFVPRPVDNQILQDNDPNFRVYDATINTFNSASTSYFHKTIGGYNAAKLIRFQDIIERHISKNNQSVLNMLNTKYFIIPGQDESPTVQRNPAALGNAWFINRIIKVQDANAEIDSLTDFDPAGEVVIHQEFNDYIGNIQPSKSGTIDLTFYSPNKLQYKSVSESEQFAVFSEIWYGPDKGWIAYIDGKEAEFIRVNYLLRGMKIPSGEHKIEFEFKPRSYFMGEKISLVSSVILLLLLAFIIYKEVKNLSATKA
ncbi:MAG: hypothetical protein IPM42_15595 [Saprospiraceae bacterium]|nr:hypothetical protein [Saprospiraceae bacterium]